MAEAPLIAIPFNPRDPEKLAYILDKCCEHRPWFDDRLWEDHRVRRRAANKRLADTFVAGKVLDIEAVWEVWRADNLLGILLLTDISADDAVAHFIFFDHNLRGKVQFCKDMIAWTFDRLNIQVLRLEIPTYAKIFASWARKKLGFRYEAEGRPIDWPKNAKPLSAKVAELGSRKHRAILYEGKWRDVLLLSQTREEFESERSECTESGRINSANAGTEPGSAELPGRNPQ